MFDYQAKARNGECLYLDISDETLSKFGEGFRFGARVSCRPGGDATVIGISQNGTLWLQFDSNEKPGLTFLGYGDQYELVKRLIHKVRPPIQEQLISLKDTVLKAIQKEPAVIMDTYAARDNLPVGFYDSVYDSLIDSNIQIKNSLGLFKQINSKKKEDFQLNEIMKLKTEIQALKSLTKQVCAQNQELLTMMKTFIKNQPAEKSIPKEEHTPKRSFSSMF